MRGVMFDIWDHKEAATTPKSSHLLAIDIHRNPQQGESRLNTRCDSPNCLWTCGDPPGNKEVAHSKRKEVLAS
jgi:hypothetical protein